MKMGKVRKGLRKVGIVTAMVYLLQFGQLGCTNKNPTNDLIYRDVAIEELLANSHKYTNQPIKIKGVPYGVGVYYGDSELVIFLDKDGKGIMCVSKCFDSRNKFAKLEALVEAAINTKEQITIRGLYDSDKNEFRFNEVEAKGYTINLGRS